MIGFKIPKSKTKLLSSISLPTLTPNKLFGSKEDTKFDPKHQFSTIEKNNNIQVVVRSNESQVEHNLNSKK